MYLFASLDESRAAAILNVSNKPVIARLPRTKWSILLLFLVFWCYFIHKKAREKDDKIWETQKIWSCYTRNRAITNAYVERIWRVCNGQVSLSKRSYRYFFNLFKWIFHKKLSRPTFTKSSTASPSLIKRRFFPWLYTTIETLWALPQQNSHTKRNYVPNN